MFGRKDVKEMVVKIKESAKVAYNANMNTFTVFGIKFTIVRVAPGVAQITCKGKDAGLRIERGIPVVE